MNRCGLFQGLGARGGTQACFQLPKQFCTTRKTTNDIRTGPVVQVRTAICRLKQVPECWFILCVPKWVFASGTTTRNLPRGSCNLWDFHRHLVQPVHIYR